jgi:hypothetical protein
MNPSDKKPALILPGYDNPRKLPETWIMHYLERDRSRLAVDLLRAFDENFKLQRRVRVQRTLIYFMSLIVSPLIGEIVKLLFRMLLNR